MSNYVVTGEIFGDKFLRPASFKFLFI